MIYQQSKTNKFKSEIIPGAQKIKSYRSDINQLFYGDFYKRNIKKQKTSNEQARTILKARDTNKNETRSDQRQGINTQRNKNKQYNQIFKKEVNFYDSGQILYRLKEQELSKRIEEYERKYEIVEQINNKSYNKYQEYLKPLKKENTIYVNKLQLGACNNRIQKYDQNRNDLIQYLERKYSRHSSINLTNNNNNKGSSVYFNDNIHEMDIDNLRNNNNQNNHSNRNKEMNDLINTVINKKSRQQRQKQQAEQIQKFYIQRQNRKNQIKVNHITNRQAINNNKVMVGQVYSHKQKISNAAIQGKTRKQEIQVKNNAVSKDRIENNIINDRTRIKNKTSLKRRSIGDVGVRKKKIGESKNEQQQRKGGRCNDETERKSEIGEQGMRQGRMNEQYLRGQQQQQYKGMTTIKHLNTQINKRINHILENFNNRT